MLPPDHESRPRQKEPKPRIYKNPIAFVRTLAQRIGQKNEWELVIMDAPVLREYNTFAAIGRLDPDIAIPYLFIDPRLSPPQRTYALTWSLGMIVLTRNFVDFGEDQREQASRRFTIAKINKEVLEDHASMPVEETKRNLPFWASAFAALLLTDENVYNHYRDQEGMDEHNACVATAHVCGIPYELVQLWVKLQNVPKDRRDDLLGMDPRQWAKDLLGHSFSVKEQKPSLPLKQES